MLHNIWFNVNHRVEHCHTTVCPLSDMHIRRRLDRPRFSVVSDNGQKPLSDAVFVVVLGVGFLGGLNNISLGPSCKRKEAQLLATKTRGRTSRLFNLGRICRKIISSGSSSRGSIPLSLSFEFSDGFCLLVSAVM